MAGVYDNLDYNHEDEDPQTAYDNMEYGSEEVPGYVELPPATNDILIRESKLEEFQAHSGMDHLLARSLLESTGWDVEAAKLLVEEDRRANGALKPINVEIVFDDTRYNLELPPNSSVAELKEAVEKETNINPEEQMLLDSTTQMEMPPSTKLADIQNSQPQLVFHLLSPNSAA
eukprot:m.79756 g.79756  ORF g.79756 m.79756 type:complete len:174 (-) comp12728_c0_seq1:1935-2456(-)